MLPDGAGFRAASLVRLYNGNSLGILPAVIARSISTNSGVDQGSDFRTPPPPRRPGVPDLKCQFGLKNDGSTLEDKQWTRATLQREQRLRNSSSVHVYIKRRFNREEANFSKSSTLRSHFCQIFTRLDPPAFMTSRRSSTRRFR